MTGLFWEKKSFTARPFLSTLYALTNTTSQLRSEIKFTEKKLSFNLDKPVIKFMLFQFYHITWLKLKIFHKRLLNFVRLRNVTGFYMAETFSK
jgi:hypothetical protein